MKKCFTINPSRSTEEIKSYIPLFSEDIYQAIEIFYPGLQEDSSLSSYTKDIKEILTLFPNIEVVLHLPFGSENNLLSVGTNNAAILNIKNAIDYASLFNATKLTLHLGIIPNGIERAYAIELLIPILTDLCNSALKGNMDIMIENMPSQRELGYCPDEIKLIIEKTNMDNLKFILDTGHAHISNYPICEYIYKLRNFLYHLHFNDNDGKVDQHLPLGAGTIDFYEVFAALNDINYQELYCLEILYKDVDNLRQNAKDIDKYDIFAKSD